MHWNVEFADEFDREFEKLPQKVQDEILAGAEALALRGPWLGRPLVDTLNGSKHSNMKELRFKADDGVWRVAFAFDPDRTGIILVAGDKSGIKESGFYKRLIRMADERFDRHLKRRQCDGKKVK